MTQRNLQVCRTLTLFAHIVVIKMLPFLQVTINQVKLDVNTVEQLVAEKEDVVNRGARKRKNMLV